MCRDLCLLCLIYSIQRQGIFVSIELPLLQRETIVSEGNSGRTLVAFLPSILMAGRYLGNQILSEAKNRELSVIAREISQSTVQPTPQGTRNAMDAVYSAVSEKVCSLSLNPENTLVLGESIGCCHASRFAAELGTKRLILALPGSKLAECIFESCATRGEAREAQRQGFGLEDYQRALLVYDPLLYVPQISGRVIIPLATHDIMIPTRRGQELVDAFQAESENRGDLKVTPQIYRYHDHCSGAFRFTRNFGNILAGLLS